MVNAQEWLDNNYPLIERNKITELNIGKIWNTPSEKKLTGELTLTGFSNLTTLTCYNNQLTNLDLTHCPSLTEFFCYNNQLTNLDLTHCPSLTTLNCWNNNNLKGSLQLFNHLTKLKMLNIKNTKLTGDLTSLPVSLKEIYCQGTSCATELADYEKKDRRNDIYYDYQAWRKDYLLWKQRDFSEQEIKEWINVGLKHSEPNLANYLKQNGYTPTTANNIPELRNKAQIYVDANYPLSTRENIKELDISNKNLTGSLNLAGFTNLEELNCSDNQLTYLELSHCANLKELDCSNNQLTDINFPPDAVLLEKVNIDGNEKLDYAEIDSKFLKYLPTLTKHEIKEISEEEFKELIKERTKIHGKIENIQLVPTWWNPNCALVINKVVWRAIHLVIYEPTEQNRPKLLEVIKVTGDLETLSREKARAKVQELTAQLNSDNPILAIYNDTSFSPKQIIVRSSLPEEVKTNPDQYLSSTDMVWREMEGKVSSALNAITDVKHVSVYLGNKRVAHIGSSKFAKFGSSLNPSNPSSNKAFMGARNDHWQDFLCDTNKLFRYHLIIPFQRPEIIQERLTKAIVGGYGQAEYNFLKENCEHFATLCVTGIPFSTQVDKLLITNHLGKLINPKDLLTAIKNSDSIISSKVTTEQMQAAKDKFLANRRERVAAIQSKSEKTVEDEQLLTQFQFEIASLTETTTAQIELPPKNN